MSFQFLGSTTINYPAGDTRLKYTGETDENGLPSGKGVMLYAKGDAVKYVGEWLHDQWHGHAKITFADDDEFGRVSFEGLYKNSMFEHGTMIWKTKGRYEGAFKDNKFTPNGTYYYTDGSKYVGEWLNNNRHGHGITTFPDDDTYGRKSFEGEYENGNAVLGTLTWKEDGKYVGDYKDGERTGKGTFYYTDGSKYVGEWLNNKRNGHGITTFPDDDSSGRKSFEGEYENDKALFGTLTWKSGSKYVGDFKDGERTGQGILYFIDGTKYIGEWLNNKQHGQGILYSADGEVLTEGNWQNGTFDA